MRYLLLGCAVVLFGCGAKGLHEDAADDIDVVAEPNTATTQTATSKPSPGGAVTPQDHPGALRFAAVVRVSKIKEGEEKRLAFRGVMLDRERAPQVVASYSGGPVWEALDGLRVQIVAEPYVPQGRAVGGDHMDVLELRVVEPTPNDRVVAFGPSRDLRGRFATERGEPGSKSEGSSTLTFIDSSGTRWEVPWSEAFGEKKAPPEGEVKVSARAVELSKFMARTDGPFLWVHHLVRD